MGLLTKTCAVLVLVFFGLASEHCTLERLPGFSFLQCCCSDEHSEPVPSECSDEVCSSLESGFYRSENGFIDYSLPLLTAELYSSTSQPKLIPLLASGLRPDWAPPDLSSGWRFSFRAAAPPRAPTILP